MVNVDITRNHNKDIVQFSVIGHANMAPHGADIVCAGISALTQATVIGLERYVGSKIEVTVESGSLSLQLISMPNSQTNAILETMLLGLTEIAYNYPKSVQIREHRR